MVLVFLGQQLKAVKVYNRGASDVAMFAQGAQETISSVVAHALILPPPQPSPGTERQPTATTTDDSACAAMLAMLQHVSKATGCAYWQS